MAPEFISGFRMAVDYYDITVSDAISSLREEQILERCYDSPVGSPWGSDNEYCQLITRDDDGALIEVIQNVQNLNELSSKGYDMSAEYVFKVADLGSFTLKADMTHVIERSQTSVDKGVTLKEEYSGYLGTFKDKASASLTWRMDNLRLRWRTTYRGPVTDSRGRETAYYEPLNGDGDGGIFLENEAACQAGEASCVANPEAPFNHKLGSYIKHDFSASYNMNINDDYRLRVYAGVNNIFDNAGPFLVFDNDNYSSNYGGGVGRYVYAGASLRF